MKKLFCEVITYFCLFLKEEKQNKKEKHKVVCFFFFEKKKNLSVKVKLLIGKVP